VATQDSLDLGRTTALLETLLESNPSDGVGTIALGYCYLESDSLEQAEAMFLEARKHHRREPAVYNGFGLSWVKRPNGQTVGRDNFRDALALDRSYEAASYNLAMSQVATRATDVPYHIRKVTRSFPNHHDAYYKLGVWHEIRSRFDGDFVDDAMDAYLAQTEANPTHYAEWGNLARMKMLSGHHAEAVVICRRVLDEAPPYRIRVLSVLMEAYQTLGRWVEADSIATRYVSMLDAETRSHFEDVSLIASREEKRVLDELSVHERREFVHDFWQRHDPTPGTPENEKRVEHIRRVGNAMVLFSEAVQPWDTRGNVYVRYGEPKHNSRSSSLRFETDPMVVRVRNLLMAALTDEERNEIRQFHRRNRTSTRDVPRDGLNTLGRRYLSSDDEQSQQSVEDVSYRINVSDFEPAEFGMDPRVGDARLGELNPNEGSYQYGLNESVNDRTAPADIRGYPLYPVEGNRPWEYWVYTDVGDGIEVVFSAFNQHGGFGFAEPPQMGRKISRFNQRTFTQRRPENIITQAITRHQAPTRSD